MRLVGVAFLGLCVLLSTVPLSARGNVLDWASVRAISPGRALVVTVAGTVPQTGRFVSADDVSLTLRVAESDQSLRQLPRADVQRVESAPMKGGRILGTAIGGLAGGAVGWIGGLSVLLSDTPCQPSCGDRVLKGYALVIGLPILGGVIGNRIAASSRRRTIYIRP